MERLLALSFVDETSEGLRLHDAVQAAVSARLRALEPERFCELRSAAWHHLQNETRRAGASDLHRSEAPSRYRTAARTARRAVTLILAWRQAGRRCYDAHGHARRGTANRGGSLNARRQRRPRTVLLLLVALAAVAQQAASASSAGDGRRLSWSPAAGVTLTKIKSTKPREQVRVLTVDTTTGAGLDIRTPRDRFPGWARTSTMAAAQSYAIAGVNGDFTAFPGAAMHALMVDGELWTSGTQRSTALGWTADGSQAYAGTPALQMQLVGPDGTPLADVASWNAPLATFKLNGYSRRGGSQFMPPGTSDPTDGDILWCAARLFPLGPVTWSDAERTALTVSYTVDKQPEPCRAEPMWFDHNSDGVVLAARDTTLSGAAVRALTPGDTVSLRWSFVGWPGVTDVLGGSSQLVDDGVNVAPVPPRVSQSLYRMNPRTSLGMTEGCADADPTTTCSFIIVTVDGRQQKWSVGMTLTRLAKEHLELGSWDAINLDGGGSTTMWLRKRDKRFCRSFPDVGGCLVNQPSGAYERSITSALTVIRRLDPETPPTLLTTPSPTPTASPSPTP